MSQFVDNEGIKTFSNLVKNEIKSQRPTVTLVTLTVAGWNTTSKTQTVTVGGISAIESLQLITPIAHTDSRTAYNKTGCKAIRHDTNNITFICDTIPSEDLKVWINIKNIKNPTVNDGILCEIINTDYSYVESIESIDEAGNTETISGNLLELEDGDIYSFFNKTQYFTAVNNNNIYFSLDSEDISNLITDSINVTKEELYENYYGYILKFKNNFNSDNNTDIKATIRLVYKFIIEQNIVSLYFMPTGVLDSNNREIFDNVSALDTEILKDGDINIIFPADLLAESNENNFYIIVLFNEGK